MADDVEARVRVAEEELNLLKNQVQQTLLDVREHILDLVEPASGLPRGDRPADSKDDSAGAAPAIVLPPTETGAAPQGGGGNNMPAGGGMGDMPGLDMGGGMGDPMGSMPGMDDPMGGMPGMDGGVGSDMGFGDMGGDVGFDAMPGMGNDVGFDGPEAPYVEPVPTWAETVSPTLHLTTRVLVHRRRCRKADIRARVDTRTRTRVDIKTRVDIRIRARVNIRIRMGTLRPKVTNTSTPSLFLGKKL